MRLIAILMLVLLSGCAHKAPVYDSESTYNKHSDVNVYPEGCC